MKKGLILTASLAMVLGIGAVVSTHLSKPSAAKAVDSGTVIYLDTSGGDWFSDNAKVALWNHQGGVFEEFTLDSEIGLYKTTLSTNCTSFNVVRGTALDWGNIWNQSDDSVFETGKNLIVSHGYSGNTLVFTWDTYTPKVSPSTETNSFYVYDKGGYLGDTFANINVYGFDQEPTIKPMSWPGTHSGIEKDIKLGDFDVYQVSLSVSYPSFILNNGTVQTGDITDLGDHIGNVLVIYNNGSTKWNPASYYTDVPASEGYYLLGTATEWSFVGAPKLSAGDDENHAKLLNYNATKNETFKVVQYVDEDRIYYGNPDDDGNCTFDDDGAYNIYLSKSNSRVYVEKVPDTPENEGYYICGVFSGVSKWTYDKAIAMTSTSVGQNVARYLGLTVAINDELRVRSYFDDQSPKDRYADFGETDPTKYEGYGEISDNNFKFTKAGDYDIYAKYEEDHFVFYVAEHVSSFSITMTAVKFEGSAKLGTQALESQVAYAGEEFEPVVNGMDGFVLRGVYSDSECTTLYSKKEFTAAGELYVKYTKVGYYVISEADNWSIDAAVAMTTVGIKETNNAEAFVTVAAANECYSFIYYDGEMAGQTGLGDTYSYAEYEDNHVKFTAPGSYAVYFGKDSKIYLNNGLTAFLTTFETEITGVCSGIIDGKKDVNDLKAKWDALADIYALVPDGKQKTDFVNIGFDGGNPDGDLEHRVIAKYNYVVNKYGTNVCKDFVWGQTISSIQITPISIINNDSFPTLTTIFVVIAATSYLAFTAIIIIKKKKSNK